MFSLRPHSELNRRSRVKSVISRRAITSRSSSGGYRSRSTSDDGDHDLSAEDDEILSCFLDEPFDYGFPLDDGDGLPDLKEVDEPRFIQLDGHNAGDTIDQDNEDEFLPIDNLGSVELVQLRQKRNRRKNQDQDACREKSLEEPVQKSHVQQTEAKISGKTQNDFIDMALSRDTPDIGLDRAEPTNTGAIIHPKIRVRSSLQNGYRKPSKFEPTVVFGWFDILIGICAIMIFFVDIGTDIDLAANYFRRKMWMYGGVTLGLIIWPSLVTTVLGLHWYIIDYKREKDVVEKIKKAKKKAFITPGYVWFFRFLFTLLQMGPVFRIMGYLYYGIMTRNKNLTDKQRNRYYHFMLYEDVDSCLLRLFESFLEAAPQLSWQLYIAMVLKESDDVVRTSLRAIALLSSWGSLAISLVSYHRSLRNSNPEKAKMKWSSVPFYFIWRASEIGGRVLCIATFASAFQLWIFAPMLFHWVFMSVWLMAQKTSFYKNTCQEKTFNVICGYVMIFCFLNLREGLTRYRFLLFYFILYVENFFMLGFWYKFSPDLGEWYHLWGFIVILVLFALHVIFQLLYYCFFHPTENIKICLRCDTQLVYESLCYDLESTVDCDSQPTDTLVSARTMDSIINHTHNRSPTHNRHLEVQLKVTTV